MMARSPDTRVFAGELVEPVPGRAALRADSSLDDNGRRRTETVAHAATSPVNSPRRALVRPVGRMSLGDGCPYRCASQQCLPHPDPYRSPASVPSRPQSPSVAPDLHAFVAFQRRPMLTPLPAGPLPMDLLQFAGPEPHPVVRIVAQRPRQLEEPRAGHLIARLSARPPQLAVRVRPRALPSKFRRACARVADSAVPGRC